MCVNLGRRMSRNNARTLLECDRSPRDRKTADLFHHSGRLVVAGTHYSDCIHDDDDDDDDEPGGCCWFESAAAAAASMNHETKIFCGGRTDGRTLLSCSLIDSIM